MNKSLLKDLISVVREAKDYSITFTFTLSSKNWYFEEKSGTDANPKETKEMLLEDLKQSLQEILDDDDEELLQYCEFKEV
ncbi:MAG: hypothetical protein ACTSV5_06355 [Promethearchaeota archaeon]